MDRNSDEGLSISPQRIEAFSDAVFAVAITLLVLSIHLPAHKILPSNLGKELIKLGPNYFAYVLSFAIIGVFWLRHHSVFRMVERRDAGLYWLNLLFLALIVYVPFPTSILSDYSNTREATILYAASLAALGLSMCLMVLYASWGKRLISDDEDRRLARHLIYMQLNMSLIFLISIPIAFASPSAAKYFWILIFFTSVAIERIFRKSRRAATG